MSALDRDKAREVLRRYADWDDTSIEDATLDRLEECVTPAAAPTIDPAAIRTAVGRVLFNASNYPKAVQARILGQDTSMLRGLIVNAVLDLLQPDPELDATENDYADLLRRTQLLDQQLAAIATLCDNTILHDHDGFDVVYVSRIRAVLDGGAA